MEPVDLGDVHLSDLLGRSTRDAVDGEVDVVLAQHSADELPRRLLFARIECARRADLGSPGPKQARAQGEVGWNRFRNLIASSIRISCSLSSQSGRRRSRRRSAHRSEAGTTPSWAPGRAAPGCQVPLPVWVGSADPGPNCIQTFGQTPNGRKLSTVRGDPLPQGTQFAASCCRHGQSLLRALGRCTPPIPGLYFPVQRLRGHARFVFGAVREPPPPKSLAFAAHYRGIGKPSEGLGILHDARPAEPTLDGRRAPRRPRCRPSSRNGRTQRVLRAEDPRGTPRALSARQESKIG